MRKLIGAFLGLTSMGTFAVLGACSSDSSSSPPPTTDGGTSDAATSDSGGQTPQGQFDCAGTKAGEKLTIIHQWTDADAPEEHAKFLSILKPLTDACSITLDEKPTRDAATLDAEVTAGSVDLAIWNSAGLAKYEANLKELDKLVGRKDSYAEFFVAQGTRNGRWLGAPVKADLKTLIWYSPKTFKAEHYAVPTSWDELNTLVEVMASKADAKKITPWAMGFESGSATGWTGSDFIQDIVLVTQGPDYVFNVISGATPYNDPGMKGAWTIYGKWASDAKYTVGGADGTLKTAFGDAIFQVFNPTPTAYMLKQSGFVSGNIVKKYPNYKLGEDFDVFTVPGAKGVQGGADWMMAFQDKPAVRAVVGYLTSLKGGANWAKSGLGVSPNKGASGNYTDPLLSKFGETLATTKGFTPDIGDTIPAPFGTAEWQGLVDFVGHPANIDTDLAAVAKAQSDALK